MVKFFLPFLLTVKSLASIPPIESLFRNGSNGANTPNTAILQLRVRELPETDPLRETPFSSQKVFDRYYEIIFNRDRRERVKLLQAEYTNPKAKHNSITWLYEKKRLLKYFENKKDIDSEKDIFWGVIIGLVLNKSSAISAFLKKTNSDYQTNKEIINQERKALYRNYQKYLQTIKDGPELKETLVSPLAPTDENKRKKVRKLMQAPFYGPSSVASLVKEGEEFYILVKLEKVRAKFANRNFKLVDLSYRDPRGDIELKAFDYHLTAYARETPKSILFSSFDKKYHIQMVSLKYASYRQKTLAKMKNSLRKAMAKGRKEKKGKAIAVPRPGFLF